MIICSFAPNTKKLQKAAEADVSWTNSHFGLLIADDQSQWMKFINLSFVTGRLTGQRQCCLIVTTPNPRYSNNAIHLFGLLSHWYGRYKSITSAEM